VPSEPMEEATQALGNGKIGAAVVPCRYVNLWFRKRVIVAKLEVEDDPRRSVGAQCEFPILIVHSQYI
jgi:hypothetical protein